MLPPALGDLEKLEALVLDNNQLTGGLPAKLGDLTEPEDLHLQTNNFVGRQRQWDTRGGGKTREMWGEVSSLDEVEYFR